MAGGRVFLMAGQPRRVQAPAAAAVSRRQTRYFLPPAGAVSAHSPRAEHHGRALAREGGAQRGGDAGAVKGGDLRNGARRNAGGQGAPHGQGDAAAPLQAPQKPRAPSSSSAGSRAMSSETLRAFAQTLREDGDGATIRRLAPPHGQQRPPGAEPRRSRRAGDAAQPEPAPMARGRRRGKGQPDRGRSCPRAYHCISLASFRAVGGHFLP